MAALGIAFFTSAATLLVYLVKSFLSRAEDHASRCLEVTARTQPELFQFVREVCQEIGCAMPKRVYLSHEVNAAVLFPVSGWRLIVPPPKSLLIGLGLVEDLNLVEFKALLAHELGHFSQRSLNLSGFIAVAHCVVSQLVFARDRWDEWLLRLSETPWVCAVAAPPYIVVGMARSLLGRVFYRLTLADLALRRQMEFHADLLAVSVAGSDAPVHLLLKCDFLYACQQQTLASLAIAARYGQYSSNLLFHQRHEAQRLRDHHQDPRLGQPPELPADPAARTQVFSPEIETVAAMWADHPSHYDREQNAKRCYYRSPCDDRPASLLFRDLDGLWEQLSQRFYRGWLEIEPDSPLLAADVVQEFVDDERASLTVAPRYHGVYDHRCLELDDLDQLIRDAEQDVQPAGDEVRVTAEDFYSDSLRTWVEAYHQRQSEFAFLNMVHWGECCTPDGELDFRGRRYLAADAGRLLLEVHEELERDRQHFAQFDAAVFRAHLRLARNLGRQDELCERYRCCRGVQDLARRWDSRRRRSSRCVTSWRPGVSSVGTRRSRSSRQRNGRARRWNAFSNKRPSCVCRP